MMVLKVIWMLIFTVISLIILVGCLWLLRVAIEWWFDVDYVKKIKETIRENNNARTEENHTGADSQQ